MSSKATAAKQQRQEDDTYYSRILCQKKKTQQTIANAASVRVVDDGGQCNQLACSTSNECTLVALPPELKPRISSFLSPKDAFAFSRTCKGLRDDLAISQLPMKISFKSWYGGIDSDLPENHGENNEGLDSERHQQYRRRRDAPRRGPKIPYLSNRTHSVTLTGTYGSWSHQGYGDWRGEFYIVAHKKRDKNTQLASANHNNEGNGENVEGQHSFCHWLPFDGGRVVWGSPLESSNLWSKLTLTFVPRNDETYYLYIKPGPGGMMLGHSLHVSNLIAHVTFYDDYGYLLTKQYKTIVKHISKVEDEGKNRAAFYTRILEAVARSIRIQLAKSNALDPVLERFFESTGTKRDTTSLLVLEEIARFLSEHACISERRKYHDKTNSNEENEDGNYYLESNGLVAHSAYGGGGDSIPDWVPYADSARTGGPSAGLDDSGTDSDDYTNQPAVLQPRQQREQLAPSSRGREEKLITKCVQRVRRFGRGRGTMRRLRQLTASLSLRPRRRYSDAESAQLTTAMETAMESSNFSLARDSELEQVDSVVD